jgi:predicted nucleic acid-binding protein
MQAANYRVILDACVLANFAVCDLFLRLAETPKLYVPLWSRDILDETERVQLRALNWKPKIAQSFRDAVETAFPEAMVSGYGRIIESLDKIKDPDDRHVLAAAIRGPATTIVTFNVSDFPPESVLPWDLEVRHPSDYLLTLYSISPAVVVKKLGDIARKKKTDVETVLITHGVPCPGFAAQLLKDLTG